MARLGEIYQLQDDNTRYFQFVVRDLEQLNSDVIAVIKSGKYDTDSTANKLEKHDIDFFTHTTVSAGVNRGLWSKVGKLDVVDMSEALFKDVYHEDLDNMKDANERDHDNWQVWHPNQKGRTSVGKDIDKYPNAELGSVYSPPNVVHRILEGKYTGSAYFGQEK